MLHGNSLSDRRSPPASKADMENDADAPELPFFFPDKDSICHEAICSLLVRISMISNNSTMQHSPWCNLCTRLSTDATKPYDEGPAEYIFFFQRNIGIQLNTSKHTKCWSHLYLLHKQLCWWAYKSVHVISISVIISYGHINTPLFPNTSVICPPVNSMRKSFFPSLNSSSNITIIQSDFVGG